MSSQLTPLSRLQTLPSEHHRRLLTRAFRYQLHLSPQMPPHMQQQRKRHRLRRHCQGSQAQGLQRRLRRLHHPHHQRLVTLPVSRWRLAGPV
jgi:hypothetical protein